MGEGVPRRTPPVDLERGLERLRSFDLEGRVFETATRDAAWLRANPEDRAAYVHRAFEDPAINGVVAAMGGNCAHELLSPRRNERSGRTHTRFSGSSDDIDEKTETIRSSGRVDRGRDSIGTDDAADGPSRRIDTIEVIRPNVATVII